MKGATLAALRRKDGLSQERLAVLATTCLRRITDDPERGISESLIALIETDRRQPSLANAEAIAAALDVPLDAIADITPEAVA